MVSKDQSRQLTNWIRARVLELGFSACGFSKAEKLEKDDVRLMDWLFNGFHGEMSYMARNVEKRTDPRLLFEGAKSVISVLMNYFPEHHLSEKNNYKISRYAYGRDYHEEIRGRLEELIASLRVKIESFSQLDNQPGTRKPETGTWNPESISFRAFVDSAPVMEKAWAERSGLGWIGKNTCLIHPKLGSYVFVGEILTDLELEYDTDRVNDLCGGCTRCIDACPTAAIISPRVLDARKCISYLTIEFKGELPPLEKDRLKDWIFGCDICQEVCPWNRFAKPHEVVSFQPRKELMKMEKPDWKALTEDQFRDLFQGSAVKRTKFSGLKRNIEFLSET
jgi:epoxyqueuosine reductase